MSTHDVSTDRLREAIGSLLCLGIPGPRLDDATRATLQRLHVGTVILFRRNVGNLDELKDLCAALHALPSRPLVAIDHEGGRVMRVGAPFTHFPAAAAIGRGGDPRIAYQVGHAMAAELLSVGVDLSFAPVLDVNSNPANPVIGDRSFGAAPELVAAMGIAQMNGLRDGGVVPCGKHFPGHGDTEKDSHHELPIVTRSRAEIERVELVPFRAAIAADIPMIMTAHVVYTNLDPTAPATMSRSIVSDLLRGELGFRGVVATDDLDMRAIADHQSIGAAAVKIVQAGVDMLLICNALDKAVEAFAAIERALDDAMLEARQIIEAAQRIRALPGLVARQEATCLLPNAAHQALADAIAGGRESCHQGEAK